MKIINDSLLKIIANQKLQINFLQYQLELYKKTYKNSRKIDFSGFDRFYLSFLFFLLFHPVDLCYIVVPDTLKKWWRLFLKNPVKNLITKAKSGRPPVIEAIRDLVIKLKLTDMSFYTIRKIRDNLKELGYRISHETVRAIIKNNFYLPKGNWKKFIDKCIEHLFAMDFKVIETANKQLTFVLFIIALKTREIIHYNITEHPDTRWMMQQIRNMRFKLGDNCKIKIIHDGFGSFKSIDFESFKINNIKISKCSPDMNAYIERFIRSFSHEALYKFKKRFLNLSMIRYITKEYVTYYNNYRPHQGLDGFTIPTFKRLCESKIPYVYKNPDPSQHKLRCKKFLGGRIKQFYYAPKKRA